MTVMGMGMVFLVLGILVVLVYFFNWVYRRYVEKEEAEEQSVSARPSVSVPPASFLPAREAPSPAPGALSPAKVAAIVAAVESLAGPGWRVARVTPAAPGWAAAGRQALMEERHRHLGRSR